VLIAFRRAGVALKCLGDGHPSGRRYITVWWNVSPSFQAPAEPGFARAARLPYSVLAGCAKDCEHIGDLIVYYRVVWSKYVHSGIYVHSPSYHKSSASRESPPRSMCVWCVWCDAWVCVCVCVCVGFATGQTPALSGRGTHIAEGS
jgi:hypothetical protein